MRWWSIVGGLLLASACPSEKPRAVPPKRPNNELIVGGFERRPPVGTQAIRFEPDGSYRLAKSKDELDRTPRLGDGKYKLEGDVLTLSAEQGQCAEDELTKEATYKVVLSKVGIRFEKDNDTCEARAKMDGQTW